MSVQFDTPLSLLERVKDGDEEAWKAFAQKYTGVLQQWCKVWSISQVDSEDVIQDALLAVLIGIPKFERQRVGSFRRWIKTIARNCWSDAVSRSERLKYLDLKRTLQSPAACHELEEQFDRIAVEELLQASLKRVRRRVEERTWEAFRLTALEEQSAAKVAELLNMRVDAIYAARCRVQKLISDEFKQLDQD